MPSAQLGWQSFSQNDPCPVASDAVQLDQDMCSTPSPLSAHAVAITAGRAVRVCGSGLVHSETTPGSGDVFGGDPADAVGLATGVAEPMGAGELADGEELAVTDGLAEADGLASEVGLAVAETEDRPLAALVNRSPAVLSA